MYGGWVVLTAAAGVSRVPYMGWKGDYSKLDVLDFIAVLGLDAGNLTGAGASTPSSTQWV